MNSMNTKEEAKAKPIPDVGVGFAILLGLSSRYKLWYILPNGSTVNLYWGLAVLFSISKEMFINDGIQEIFVRNTTDGLRI